MTRATGPTPGSAADDSPDADPERVARAILLRQLALGPRTEAQLRDALTRRNVPVEVAEVLLVRFTEVGLIDDAAYAEALIRSEAAAGGLSRRRVADRLQAKGVSDELAAEAVAQIDPDQELEAARTLAARQMRRLGGLERAVAQRRLAGVLARRGYPPDTVRRVVRDAFDELEVQS